MRAYRCGFRTYAAGRLGTESGEEVNTGEPYQSFRAEDFKMLFGADNNGAKGSR